MLHCNSQFHILNNSDTVGILLSLISYHHWNLEKGGHCSEIQRFGYVKCGNKANLSLLLKRLKS